ncbi:hypothetical protein NEUTE1DRAFT_105947 [Neurospora tetrasperma FGSC 2508]|uniref:Uncharacterized protein n=1 Tax=Neurospora tetrasperma (strain FGSC 2508 / ATCC MYA-4615 / P0657) TaxID=510951 RepID=F8N0R2_NEUT8|nr:uncharacterized protein NEUTE1DRAFT_105947 [Neurospora tetrasperma FGSC 2508]EGO52998.1 hypothetical protein NEUTE1DRAFT_105947 [Neurospora tetrasperma FGSC 2508]
MQASPKTKAPARKAMRALGPCRESIASVAGFPSSVAKLEKVYTKPSQVPIVLEVQRPLTHCTVKEKKMSVCTKLPVPTPISTVTTNKAETAIAPKGNQTTRTTSNVKTFMIMMVFTGPSFRSDSHEGSVLPTIAPLTFHDISGKGDFDQSECSTYKLLGDLPKMLKLISQNFGDIIISLIAVKSQLSSVSAPVGCDSFRSTRKFPMVMKAIMMPARMRMPVLHSYLLKSSWRTREKKIPPTAEPTVTHPVARPSRILNHWLTTVNPTVVGAAVEWEGVSGHREAAGGQTPRISGRRVHTA